MVTLFYLTGMELNRIAERLDIPVGTAKSRLHRSRRLMRERTRAMTSKPHECTDPLSRPPRDVIGGMRGLINWQVVPADPELSSWRPPSWSDREALEKTWRVEGNAIVGESGEPGEEPPALIAGEPTWTDYELSFLMTPISGGNAQVAFRLSADERSYYLFDFLLGWQAVGLVRRREAGQPAHRRDLPHGGLRPVGVGVQHGLPGRAVPPAALTGPPLTATGRPRAVRLPWRHFSR